MVNHSPVDGFVTIENVLITHELTQRPARPPNYETESQALATLAREMINNPRGVLQKLAEIAMKLCHADSAGVSILEHGDEGDVFRWRAVTGLFSDHLNGTTPRDKSPCEVVVADNTVQLFNEPWRYFPALRDAKPLIHEGLLAPWSVDDGVNEKAIGTVWVIAHRQDLKFDAEDARLLQSLTSFASIAYQMVTALDKAKIENQALEKRVADRTHFLLQTNEKLQQEVEQRRHAETALHAIEAQLAVDLASMRRLYQLHARLATETDLSVALDEILAAACEFTDTDRGCVQLLSEDRRHLEIIAQRGYGPDSPFIEHFRYEDFDQEYGIAHAEGRRLLIEDRTTFSGLAGTSDGESALAEGILAIQSTPMVSRKGEMMGVLSTQFRQPHRSSDNELHLVGLLAWTAADFIERYRAEKALRESESRFRVLADASPALTWQIDAQGNAIFLNQRYLDVTGMTPEQLMAQGWHSILHPDDLPQYLAATGKALRQQAAFQSRVRLKVKDGTWRWFETYAAPWHSMDAKYQGHVGITVDITEMLETQKALQEADRRKDEFLATLAHELRNPLAPITMALHLLRHTHTGGRRSADRMIGIMDRQVAHMVRLIDDLLEISRITRGKIELSKERVNLIDIIHGAVESSLPHIEGGKHHLTLALPEQPLWISGDAVRLNQVFANLLNNAAKYTNEGGQITLTASVQGQQAVVSVRDNGLGIPSEMLTQVFGLFQQTAESRSKAKGGLGIGLSMVQRLVQMHEGSVEARSEGVNKGSEFIIHLPLLQDAESKPQCRMELRGTGESRLAGCSVLVVDDNQDAANTLATMLETDGATVRLAYTGIAALAALENYRPNVIVLDIGLPDISGYEVARRIREMPELKDVHLIALSGWGQESDRKKSSISGFNEHLTKPVDIAALEALLVK